MIPEMTLDKLIADLQKVRETLPGDSHVYFSPCDHWQDEFEVLVDKDGNVELRGEDF